MIVLYTTERDYPWGTLRSTHGAKTKVVLEEKGLSYRIENLPPGNLWKKPPEMIAKHPLGKVPYLEDGELVIFDSTVIDEYLDERYPEPRLMPSDPIARMRVRELENFADEAMLVGSVPPIWMPYWSEPAKRNAESMEKGRAMLLSRDLPYLEKVLRSSGDGYACGEFSLADAPLMSLAMVLEVDAPNLDAFPKVDAYLKRLRERPSYRTISPRTKVADAATGG
ncbi:MAG: glutathione S-transferase family protein [Candidatus Binatus sp.]|uniref:glutathione S-transferase family protein n=1 Tax=Candidatus Binatus sp. TaxID=2811406 RepID=UPI0027247B9A|nr:glutathione S-transferase family protein [Candidatus Binatus sp.]MDO8430861.1 glutathione S-transferase family protein [Candidatus Binatus sp.]